MIASAFTGVITPAQFAATYALAGTRARASGVAILQLSIYIVGLAFAAAAVGALSDLLEPTRGKQSVAVSPRYHWQRGGNIDRIAAPQRQGACLQAPPGVEGPTGTAP